MTLPNCYIRSSLVGVTPVDPGTGYFGLSFELDGELVRVALPVKDAGAIQAVVTPDENSIYRTRTTDQSEMSSESPHSDGSPQGGQNVAPPTRSSNA